MSVEMSLKHMSVEADIADVQRMLSRRVLELEDCLREGDDDSSGRRAIMAMDEPFYSSLRFLAALCGINIDKLWGFTINGQPKMAAEAGRLVLDAVEKRK